MSPVSSTVDLYALRANFYRQVSELDDLSRQIRQAMHRLEIEAKSGRSTRSGWGRRETLFRLSRSEDNFVSRREYLVLYQRALEGNKQNGLERIPGEWESRLSQSVLERVEIAREEGWRSLSLCSLKKNGRIQAFVIRGFHG